MANVVDILISAKDMASRSLKSVSDRVHDLNKKMESMEEIGFLAGATLGALGMAVGAVVKEGFRYNAFLDQSNTKWKTLLGSQKAATEQMKWMQQFARTTPFDLESLDKASTLLASMGVNIKDVRKWIPAIGDAVAVIGGGSDAIENISRALAQMSAKGKVSAEEMNQLAENGVPAWNLLSKATGQTVGQLMKLSQKGQLMSSQMLPLLIQQMEKAFGGSMANQLKTTQGQWDMLKETLSQISGQLTSGIWDYLGSTILPQINNALSQISNTLQNGGISAVWNQLFSPTVQTLIIAIAGAIGGLLVGSLVALSAALAPILVELAPFVAIGIALALAGKLVYDHWSTIAPLFTAFWQVAKPIFAGIWDTFKQTAVIVKQELTPVWNNLKTSMKALMPVIAGLMGILLALLITVSAVFNGVARAIVPFIKSWIKMQQAIGQVILAIMDLIKGDYSGAMKHFKQAGRDAISSLENAFTGFENFFTGILDTIINIAKRSGNALMESFARGIRNGISKAVKAVKDGVAEVRQYLPFSPAKKGALSDLDKSGESFFPTWAGGIYKGIRTAVDAVDYGMSQMNMGLNNGFAFSGGKTTVVHRVEFSPVNGSILLNGNPVNSNGLHQNVQDYFEGYLRDFKISVRKGV